MTITVEVTQQHIARGKRRYLTSCPVALALYDAPWPGTTIVGARVDSKLSVRFTSKGWIDFKMSDEVACRVNDFDTMGTMQPFTFDIDAPEMQVTL